MTFISFEFLIFIPVFLVLYKLLEGKNRLQNVLILVGNYVFYSLIDLRFSLVLFFVTVLTWLIASRPETAGRSVLLWTGIGINLAVLFFFKYIGLFGDIAVRYGIIMPVGLSFYVFEAISFLIDRYRGKLKERYSLPDVMLYLSFFPTVMSGPIVKARDFLPQIHKERRITGPALEAGLQRFVLGVFEKVVIADRLAVSVNAVYAAPAAYSGMSLLCNSLSYTLQLFFDFAGYSHMAIGIATILGFQIPENFNLPYIAKSPSEFWRRWHISLSSWITEYVYIPLGGKRKGRSRTYINTILAMVISGIWHGSTLNFVIWGFGHGLLLVLQRIFEPKTKGGSVREAAGIVLTFLFVSFLWIPFRTPDISVTLLVFQRIFTNAAGLTYFYSYTFVFLLLLIIVEVYALVKTGGNQPLKPLSLVTFRGKLVFVTMILLILMFAYFGNSAFIYGAMF